MPYPCSQYEYFLNLCHVPTSIFFFYFLTVKTMLHILITHPHREVYLKLFYISYSGQHKYCIDVHKEDHYIRLNMQFSTLIIYHMMLILFSGSKQTWLSCISKSSTCINSVVFPHFLCTRKGKGVLESDLIPGDYMDTSMNLS